MVVTIIIITFIVIVITIISRIYLAGTSLLKVIGNLIQLLFRVQFLFFFPALFSVCVSGGGGGVLKCSPNRIGGT